MPHLNTRGATRFVILTRRSAYKIPRFWFGRSPCWTGLLNGLLANMEERSFARTGWPELCPVRWSVPGGWLIVMHRVEPLTADLTDEEYEAFVEQDDHRVPVEHKRDSFGRLGGRLVAVDYGGYGRCSACRSNTERLPA